MTKPSVIPSWATEQGGDILTGLVPISATFIETRILSGVTYGLIDYAFSGSPDLSAVLAYHRLTVSGFILNANNGTNFVIESVDNANDKIRIYSTTRTGTSLNESGVTGSATVTSSGATKQAVAIQKQAQGYIPGEKPGAGHLNWLLNLIGLWIKYLSEAMPVGYDKLQAKLTAGANIAITDNGDGTEKISASITVGSVPALSDTFTQAGHGFAVKNIIRRSGSSWVKAQGNTVAGCVDTWLVASVSGNDFVAVKTGRVTLSGHGLTVGTLYYLSSTTSGLATSARPIGDASTPLGFFLPVLFVESSSIIHVLGNGFPEFTPLLAEQQVSSGLTVSFSGLAGCAVDGDYTLECNILQTSGANRYYASVNGEQNSNYGAELLRLDGAVLTAVRNGGSASDALIAVGGGITAGSFKFQRMSSAGYLITMTGGTATYKTDVQAQFSTTYAPISADISSLQIYAGTSGPFLSGSNFRLLRNRF